MMQVVHLTKTNFAAEVLNSPDTVLVDFWAAWCGPCRALGPVVEEIAQDSLPGVKVGKVNVDEQQELAEQFGIMSIPTVIVFKDGKPALRSVGAKPKQALLELLQ